MVLSWKIGQKDPTEQTEEHETSTLRKRPRVTQVGKCWYILVTSCLLFSLVEYRPSGSRLIVNCDRNSILPEKS